ncbi:MAG: hypothetical protein ICV60_19595 [Pyrinomonadaceae bacterium]|nr:hypothetical protein [Pyrinomonadaceae bacterium]
MATTKTGSKSGSKKNATKAATKSATKAAPKAAPAAAENIHTRAFTASMSSVKALELRCEADEANLLAKIISMELGEDDGQDVTVADFEDDETTLLGELTIEEFKTDTDRQSIKAIHKTQGDTFLFEGKAFIKNNPTNVLVFRDKE